MPADDHKMEAAVAEFRNHGGELDGESLLHIVERNANEETGWRKSIGDARDLLGDNLEAILAKMFAHEHKREYFGETRPTIPDAVTPVPRRRQITHRDVVRIHAQMDRKNICFACLKEGHRVFDKHPDGTWVCEVTRARDEAGTLPSVGNPGPSPPKGRSIRKPRRLFAVLDDGDDDDDENAADEFTDSEDGKRRHPF